MLNDLCTYDGRREEVLVAYLYDDIDQAEREAFERHLPGCVPCRTELDALGTVREGLAAWAAPEVADGVGGKSPRVALRLAEPPPSPRPSGWRVLADAPVWMQAAAAMLVVAASLGLANINLTYSREGLTLTTGWIRAAAAPTEAQAATVRTAAAPSAESEQLRAELVALRQELQALRTQPVATAAAGGDELLKQVRADLQASERRVMREIGLQVAGVARDVQVQRQADRVYYDRSLGLLQNRTGMEVMRQQQQLNDLLRQRVSEQR
ncbi:MAG: anti-sigma factor [Vicinamibacterales bacterium]